MNSFFYNYDFVFAANDTDWKVHS